MRRPWQVARTDALNRRWRLTAAVLAVTVGMAPVLVGGLPASAAPPIPRRCDEVFNVTKAPPPRDQLPGIADGLETVLDDPFYDYGNQAELLRNLPESQSDMDRVGPNPDSYDSGSVDHAYAARAKYVRDKRAQGQTPLPWQKWLNIYIPNQGNNSRGVAYEGVGARTFGLSGPDWICQGQIPGAPDGRVYDAVNVKERVAYEFKSSPGAFRRSQLIGDAANAKATGWKIIYVFGQEPKAGQVSLINATEGVELHKAKATPRLTTVAPPAQGPQSGILSPRSQAPSQGPLPETLGRSGRNPAEAREMALVDEEEAQRSGRPNGRVSRPGGVDFTTMELRYVQDTADGSGLQYAFQMQDLPNDDDVSFGGLEVAQLSSDAFFAWLALPPDSFWVNLNPIQPDKIIDDKLGSTDAGRVLLEADLAMKKTIVNLIKPGTPLGDQFWDSLRQVPTFDLMPCFAVRSWIVPAAATVRENGGQLYILDAPLKVMSEPASAVIPVGSGVEACHADPPEIQEFNQNVYRTLILPKVNEAINTAPEYQDLRRVYLSRVAAEWIRQRNGARITAFSDIIGSGDVSRWPARVAWDPQEVFARYLKSFNEGEYHVEHTFRQTGQPIVVIVSFGGVDFAESPRDNVSAEQFQQVAPALPATIASSQFADTGDIDALHTWFGGLAAPPPPPAQQAPGNQGLARTGQSVGPIIGIGMMLVIGGVVLLVWVRRHRTPLSSRD